MIAFSSSGLFFSAVEKSILFTAYELSLIVCIFVLKLLP